MSRRTLVVLLVALVAVLPGAASAANCLDVSVTDKLAGAQVAFVGKVLAVTPVQKSGGVQLYDYRFQVLQGVKGDVPPQVTARAARLVDLNTQVVRAGTGDAIGVLASRSGGRLVTSSCSLVDSGSLLGAADQPKGTLIKVAIGLVLLGIVVAYSLRRLRRRRPLPPAGNSGRA